MPPPDAPHHFACFSICPGVLAVQGGKLRPKNVFFFSRMQTLPYESQRPPPGRLPIPTRNSMPSLEAPAPKKGKSRLAPGSPWDQFPGTRGGLQSPRPGSGRRRGLPWRVGMIFSWAQMDQMLACMTGNRLKRAHFYPCPTGNRPDFCRRELHASRWNFWSGFWCIVSLKSLFTFAY